MNLGQFLKGLFAKTFFKNNAMNAFDDVIKINSTYVRPMYDNLGKVFDGRYKFKDEQVIRLNKYIVDGAKATKLPLSNSNSVEIIAFVLGRMEKSLPEVRKIMDDVFKGREIPTVGLTYNKAIMIQFVEAASFMVEYAGKYATLLSSAELTQMDENRQVVSGVGPDDIDYLLKKSTQFCKLIEVMSMKPVDLKASINKATDAIVDEATADSLESVVGSEAVDPMGFAQASWPLSMLMRRQIMKGLKDIDRLEAAREEAKTVEYRIILLQEQIKSGRGDAFTEKQLELQEDRLLKLQRDITEKVQEYGV